MKSAFGIIAGILSLIAVGLARLFTADVPIRTGYAPGSLSDTVGKGVAHGLGKIFAIPMSMGAILFAGAGILVGLVALATSKDGGKGKIIFGLLLCGAAVYFGILVFASITP